MVPFDVCTLISEFWTEYTWCDDLSHHRTHDIQWYFELGHGKCAILSNG